jgi:hypothetical protein
MVSEALNSLKEAKLALQRQLAQRQEYRALLIVDKATRQLAEILDPLCASVAPYLECSAAEAPHQATLAGATRETFAKFEQREDCVGGAPIETKVAVGESLAAPSSFARLEDRAPEAPVPEPAPGEEPIKTASRAVDLFLASTAQAAPIAAAPRPRSYLPFVAAPRLVNKSADVN